MTHRPTWRSAGRAAVAAAMVVPALAVVASAAGARTGDGVYLDRRWRAFSGETNAQNARLALDARARTAYVVESGRDGVRLRAWDLDTYRPRTPAVLEAGMPNVTAATPLAVDEARHVLVMAPASGGATAVPGIRAYAVRGRALQNVAAEQTRFPAGYAVLGLGVDAPRDRLIVLGAPSAGGNVKFAGAGVGGVLVDIWRLSDLARGTVRAEHAQPLRVPQVCGQLITATYQAGVLASPDGKRLYLGCLSNRGLLTTLGPNAGDVAGVAALDIAAAAAGSSSALRLHPIPGNFANGDSLVIPGSRRLALVANSATATNFRVFDTGTGYYVGNVGLEDIGVSAIGFDAARSRGYYVINEGLGVFDAGVTPVTQGVVYEELAPVLGVLKRPMVVDPRTRRVFIITADDLNGGSDPYVGVIVDRSPVFDAAVEPEPPSLDEPEVPGVTASSRSADAAAAGAELRLVGGPNALLHNATHFDSRGILTRPGTRFEQFAVASGVRLSGDEASAEAVTTRQDPATTGDLHVKVDQAGVDVPLAPFATPVLCSDLGFTPAVQAGDSAQVGCDVAKQLANADVSAQPGRVLVARAGHPGALPAPVQVRAADASVGVKRDGALGKVVTTLRAEARGIDILGAVTIGRVTATSTVVTHGRSGTAETTYARSVAGLVVNGTEVCDTDCSTAQVRKAVDEAFNGRVRVGFPEPDRHAAKSGTSAWLRDNEFRHIERTQFDDVPDDSVLAPAMEVVVFLDGTATSRLVASFAALSAQERYRIFRVGTPGEPPRPTPRASSAPEVPLPTEPPVIEHPAGPVPPVPGTPAVERPVAAPPAPATVGDLVERITDGLKVVLRSPRQLASVAALWALLAIPVYLSARRRLLLDLPFLRRAVEES